MKEARIIFVLLIGIICLNIISAECTLTPYLINQDPYPAVPGEEVKVVFQLQGVENSNCGDLTFKIMPSFPFTLDPGYSSEVKIPSGTYVSSFNSFLLIPYKLRVDKDALDGEATIKVAYENSYLGSTTSLLKDFNITIEDVIVDFVVTIDSYSYATKKLTLGIINTGENNIKSATVEIPSQKNIDIQGGHVKILGDLDSNEDTTLTFEAVPKEGEINVIISYNDETDQRRIIEKKVLFTEIAFENTKESGNKMSTPAILLIVTWVFIIVFYIYTKIKNKKLKERQRFLAKKAAF